MTVSHVFQHMFSQAAGLFSYIEELTFMHALTAQRPPQPQDLGFGLYKV